MRRWIDDGERTPRYDRAIARVSQAARTVIATFLLFSLEFPFFSTTPTGWP